MNRNINLVGSFMEVEGNLKIYGTCGNYDHKGGISFDAHLDSAELYDNMKIVLDKNQVELVCECKTVIEIYECYKEMEFF